MAGGFKNTLVSRVPAPDVTPSCVIFPRPRNRRGALWSEVSILSETAEIAYARPYQAGSETLPATSFRVASQNWSSVTVHSMDSTGPSTRFAASRLPPRATVTWGV
jgi:hypothetical protein